MKEKNQAKQELKKFINENGFFCNAEISELKKEEIKTLGVNAIKTKTKIPEGDNIRVYRGLATQRFDGENVSRNGYKIDPEGWDFTNYLKNPVILYQHDPEKVYGEAIEVMPHEGGVDIVFWVDLNALEEKEAYRVKNGFVRALSTGHVTLESAWENTKTGERVSDYREMRRMIEDSDGEYNEDDFAFVVTKAESVENSTVTIGSNPDALFSNSYSVQDGIKNFYKNNYLPKIEMEKNLTEDLKTEGEQPEAQAQPEVQPVSETPVPVEPEAQPVGNPEPAPEAQPEDNRVKVSTDEIKLIHDLMEASEGEEQEKLKTVLNSLTDEEEKKPEVKEEKNMIQKTESNFISVNDFKTFASSIAMAINAQEESINEIKTALEKVPEQKGLIFHSQFSEKKNKPESNGLAARLLAQMQK